MATKGSITTKSISKARTRTKSSSKTAKSTASKIARIAAKSKGLAKDTVKTVTAMPAKSLPKSHTEFKLGDMVVYPGHGVGKIHSMQSATIGGSEHKFWEILVGSETSASNGQGMKIKVPVAQAQTVGLRRVVDKKAVDKVYRILKDRKTRVDTQTWNRRFREYSQKIKTGSVFEIAEVLRDLSVLSVDKELSFGEKRMLDTAQSLLVSEIAVAKARTHEKVMGEIQAIFS